MREAIVEWAESLPGPLAVVVLAMVPIIELRGAIPVGQEIFGMSRLEAYWWAVLGNLIPVPFILWLLPPVAGWAERHWDWLHRVIERLSGHTERRHTRRFERFRDLALITFVAIPLPITGAWSGSLASYVFGVDKRKSLGLIAIGVLIAGVVVTLFWEAIGLAGFVE
jgi:uncharacterized membrane protein